ncbi:CRISPR system precrRNA processing endoribonuclease RAMP protein Cas6 [Zoogloea sp.]|uniref:CRISPR system precrRNA processing endoribonuclease RAMP protein Cas6 n=1 Tax=Zoogloea sp. TaxID=49181 RepID=UPI0035B07C49
MLLIGVRLALAPEGPRSALHLADFLGGVVHGGVEHLVRRHAPAIAADLGMGIPNRIKPYAILPPPFGWRPQPDDIAPHLPFGLALHGNAVRHAEALAHALSGWREVRHAGLVDRVRGIELSVGQPAGAQAGWSPGQPFPALSAPPALARFPAQAMLSIRFLTPLRLTDASRPPGLLKLVRALRRRVEQTSPTLFAQLAGTDWVCHEEAIRRLEADSPDWRPVEWRYGSRTKDAPIEFRGHLGTLRYRAPTAHPIPGPIHTLLRWGTWFGIGERTALGQGMYLLQEGTP